MSRPDERAVVLDDWPQPAAGATAPRVLADDTVLSLQYRLADRRVAVIRFPLCWYVAFGQPNDEALAGHPLYNRGLQHYSVHEVLDSLLIAELERRNSVHPKHDPDWYYKGSKHLIFTFQDSTLECVVSTESWWTPSIKIFAGEEEANQEWMAQKDG